MTGQSKLTRLRSGSYMTACGRYLLSDLGQSQPRQVYGSRVRRRTWAIIGATAADHRRLLNFHLADARFATRRDTLRALAAAEAVA